MRGDDAATVRRHVEALDAALAKLHAARRPEDVRLAVRRVRLQLEWMVQRQNPSRRRPSVHVLAHLRARLTRPGSADLTANERNALAWLFEDHDRLRRCTLDPAGLETDWRKGCARCERQTVNDFVDTLAHVRMYLDVERWREEHAGAPSAADPVLLERLTLDVVLLTWAERWGFRTLKTARNWIEARLAADPELAEEYPKIPRGRPLQL